MLAVLSGSDAIAGDFAEALQSTVIVSRGSE